MNIGSPAPLNPRRLLLMGCLVFGLALDLAVPSLHADGGAGTQVYLVPFPEGDLHIALESLLEAKGGSPVGSEINTVLSVVVGLEGTVICYDHWEDGYEADPALPVQASSQIWGDGDPDNGIPPGFALDLLEPGDALTLENSMNVPRNPSQIRYDGRDRLVCSRPVAMTRASWASHPGPVLAGAVEILPAKDLGVEYIAPVGEDTDFDEVFEYVSLFVQATENATTVAIDSDADGAVDFSTSLQRGETYFFDGGIAQGARVTSNHPIQVQLLTGDLYPSGNYETRWYTLFPRAAWASEYYSPVGSANTAKASLVVFNPHGTALAVNYSTVAGSGTLQVPAGETEIYEIPFASGVKLVAPDGRDFSVVAAVASSGEVDNDNYDWGFSLVPLGNLTRELLVGWGPGVGSPANGVGDPNLNGNPVFVSAEEATIIYIDYDGDPLTGPSTDPLGRLYDDQIAIEALESLRIFDTGDGNQTGMRLYTVDGVRITGAWGQDPDTANPGNPFLDMGTTVLPFPSAAMEIVSVLVADANGNAVAEVGDTVEYVATLANITDTSIAITNIALLNTVPAGIAYVPNSSQLNGVAMADDGTGTSYPFDDAGQMVADLAAGQSHEVRYRGVIISGGAAITNVFTAVTGIGPLSDADTLDIPVALTQATVIQNVVLHTDANSNGAADLGDVLQYTITAYNSGAVLLTGVSLLDTLPGSLSYVASTATFNGAGIADDATGTPFPFDGSGYGTPNLGVGTSQTFSFRATVAASGVTIVNQADLVTTAGTFGSTSEIVVPAAPPAVPTVTLTASVIVDANGNGQADFGDSVRYTIYLHNGGASALTAISVVDALPAGLAYTAGTAMANGVGVADAVSGTPFPFDENGIARPDLPAGQSDVLSFDAAVIVSGTTIVNRADAFTGAGNVFGTHTLTVPARAGTTGALLLTDGSGTPVSVYTEGDTVYIRVEDPDQDVAADMADTVSTTVRNSQGGDVETVVLVETGASTGVFQGSLPTSVSAGLAGQDGILQAKGGERIEAQYVDPKFGDEATARADFGKETLIKTLYVSEGQTLDRLDPVAGGDATTSTVALAAATPIVVPLAASQDTWVNQTNSGTNYGGDTVMTTDSSGGDIGGGRLLVQFDVSGIPAGSPVTGVTLRLTKSGGSAVAQNMELHRVTRAWDAGTATWDAPWSAVGGDYESTVLDSISVSIDQEYQWSSAALIDLVQEWVDGVTVNNGLIIGSPDGGGEISDWNTSEAASAQPALAVTYAAPTAATTFAQAPAMAKDFILPADGVLDAVAYVSLVPPAALDPSPHLTATVLEDGIAVATLIQPTATDLGGSIYRLNWSGTVPATTVVETGNHVELTIANAEPLAMDLLFDSDTYPSRVDLPTRTVIEVESVGVYDGAYPGGRLVSNIGPGQTVYVRAVVSDPFGAYDITGLDLEITPPNGTPLPVENLDDSAVVRTTASRKIYESVWWSPSEEGTASISATAHEGTEGITDVRVVSLPMIAVDSGTEGSLVFATASGVVQTSFASTDAIQIRLTDLDENTDAAAIETVAIDVESTGGFFDSRILTETGVDTGIFAYLYPGSTFGDGVIITGTYSDPDDPADEASASAVINNPGGAGTPRATVAIQRVLPADGSAGIGEAIVFRATVGNPGTVDLGTVELEVSYPAANMTFVGATLPATLPAAGTLQWPNLGPLLPGEFVNVEISFRGAAPTPTATVTSLISGTAGAGPVSDSVSIHQPQVVVGLSMLSPTSGIVVTENNAVLQLSISNSGTTDLPTVPVALQFGSCYQLVSATLPDDGNGGGIAVWNNVGPILAGQTLTMDVTLRAVLPCVPAISRATVSNAIDANGDAVPVSRASISSTIIQTVSAPDVTVSEAIGSALVTVSVPLASPTPVTVDYVTTDGTATAGLDYTAQSGTATIAAGQTSVVIAIPLNDDGLFERNETFTVDLSNPVGAVLGTGATVTIWDDECEGTVYLMDSDTADLHALDFPAAATNLLQAAVAAYKIDGLGYNRRDHFLWGFKREAPWDTVVRINPDYSVDEFVIPGLSAIDYHSGDVDFSGILHLGKASEPTVKRIDVNPASPNYLQALPDLALSSADSWGDWAFNALDGLLYTVNRSEELFRINTTTGLVSNLGDLAGMTGSGPFGASYSDGSGAFYAVREETGIVYRMAAVPLLTGGTAPAVEFYTRSTPGLSSDGARCAIAPPPPAPLRLSIGDALVFEGSGTATVTVSLTETTSTDVSFVYATLDNTASAGNDYVSKSGTAVIPAGDRNVSLTLSILQDVIPEGQESFFVTLEGPSGNVILADAAGSVSITDDDSLDTDRDGAPDIDDIDDDDDGILDVDESLVTASCPNNVELLILLDNSGSISSGDWDRLTEFTEDIIDELGVSGTVRMAVAHYWSDSDADEAFLHLESDFTTDTNTVKAFSRRGDERDQLERAIPLLGNALNGSGTGVGGASSVLTRQPGSRFHVLLITDGLRDKEDKSTLVDPNVSGNPFHFLNAFKDDFDATLTTVRFNTGDAKEDAKANAAAAALSSVGGVYSGNLDSNPTDPEGSGVIPRRFINVDKFKEIPDSLAAVLADLVCENEQDFDSDGLPDHLDIDADNDGIPDNVEAQATETYRPPNGDSSPANQGLDTAYTGGLTPVDSDQDGVSDVYDDDSDADGVADIEENNDSDNALVGNDQDGDGLDDNFDSENVLWDPNDRINDPNPTTLGDIDNDLAPNGDNATAMIRDVDFRDPGKQANYADWQMTYALALGTESAPGDNPDQDLYDNLLEYALCLHPGTGLPGPGGFFLQADADGIDAVFYRPKGGLSDVTYEVRARAELPIAGTEVWSLVMAVSGDGKSPSGVTVTDLGNAIEEVRVTNLQSRAPLTAQAGFVRLTVTNDTHDSYTPVWGWTETVIEEDHQETYSTPYNRTENFSGVIDAVVGSHEIDVSTSTGGIRLDSELIPAIESYYVEIIDGDENGHRFDVTAVSGHTITLAADTDLYAGPPYNTQVTPVNIPASLAGDSFILRRHQTLDDLFPPASGAFTPQDHTLVPGHPPDRLYIYEGDWEPYWLYRNNAGTDPYWDLDGDSSFLNAGRRVMPPGQGVFLMPEETTVTMLAMGIVRKNPFAMPLPQGWSFHGSIFPMNQSPAERNMDSLSFDGSADPSSADTICFWLGDRANYDPAFRCAFLFDPDTIATPRWIYADDDFLSPRDFEKGIFPRDRSAFYFRYLQPKPDYIVPLPWCTDVIDE